MLQCIYWFAEFGNIYVLVGAGHWITCYIQFACIGFAAASRLMAKPFRDL